MSADTPAKDQDKFVLRLPEGMRDRLKAEAEANKRSMNAEIVARLEATIDADMNLAPLGSVPPEEIGRIAQAAAARAAVDAIDAVLQALALPDGTPDVERFQILLGETTESWLARRGKLKD